MKIIAEPQITSLKISPSLCVEWVRESFLMKKKALLPAKISLHPQGNDFFNTMPVIVPSLNMYGVKIVYRLEKATPHLGATLLLYNSETGKLLCQMTADWITTMRTGAVACLAAQTYRKNGEITYGFFGLGNTARATLLCILESEPAIMHKVILLKYKDQHIHFIERFASYLNVEFEVMDSPEQIIRNTDVLFSCVTDAKQNFCENNSAFREGCTVIPVHTKGFQNCDLFFDKVFGDDAAHLHSFKYFDRFHKFAELSDVLDGTCKGRENDKERILSYNIGLGLHDIVFASKIYEMLEDTALEVNIQQQTEKFWI